MVISLQIPKMDMRNKTPILVLLIISISSVSGLDIPKPDKLWLDIFDGEVIVYWNHSADAPSNTKYNVQMSKYNEKDAMKPICTGITETYCDLSGFIEDHRAAYKVRVQLVAGDDESAWKFKRFLPTDATPQPPSFTLWATSSTLAVYVHKKTILNKLFPYGLIYTIQLEERGPHPKNTTAIMKYDGGEDQETKIFNSLHWGREYCVSIKVIGEGAQNPSNWSPTQCLLLPEQEWFMIAVSSLSIMGVLAIIAIIATILLCYLKHPEKTPVALKAPLCDWHPLTPGDGTMEVVTDKGWFLSSYRTEVKNCIAKDPVTLHVTMTENNGEENRRTSTDSGVSVKSTSATKRGRSPPMRQEDSGCGSMGGPESSQTDYPLQDKRTNTDTVRKREDSGVGLGNQLDSSSLNLDALDSEPLKEFVAGGNYHSQSRSTVQIRVYDDEEVLKQTIPDPVLAEVVTGYRAGPQLCICSGAGQCTWCHKQGLNETDMIKQYRAVCIENGLLSGKCDIIDSYKEELTISSYPRTQMDTVMMSDFETTFIHLGETFPLLSALSPQTLVEGGQDINMNNVPLSLCDVQLTTD
ncbi:interleukin-10 receptor subunit alpha [Thunnus albacares]|uniref:interleukin-10 receptor subunit alpha n=1 Tax=Thunnus albacares TaxID=8236 RepID=UPI001CF62491|nr:interleukin-10 receptor subunit alpha [Thunnus albacares]